MQLGTRNHKGLLMVRKLDSGKYVENIHRFMEKASSLQVAYSIYE
jgi:hypothetical protein